MSLHGSICGTVAVLRGGRDKLQVARITRLNGPRAPRRYFRPCFLRQHRQYIHQEAFRISTSFSGLQDGSAVCTSNGKPCREAAVPWPDNITDKVRQIVHDGDSGSIPFGESSVNSASRTSSFVSRADMQRRLQEDDAQAFWSRVKRAISRPLSGEAAAADDSFGDLEGATKGNTSAPIVYKRYVDGMTAAHHYPSRLLPACESRQIPPLFYVTPFDLEEKLDSPISNQGLGFKGTELFKGPRGIQPKTTLLERLYGRVSILFLFDLGGQYSQPSDVAFWMRQLECHSSFLSSIYGPVFASGVSTPQKQLPLPPHLGTRDTIAPDLANVSYICIDHSPFWLRPLAIRSMCRLAPSFHPLSPFHEFPHRLPPEEDLLMGKQKEGSVRRLAEEYARLCLLIGDKATSGTLVGSFMGYSGGWGAAETEALKRRERHKFVTVLLVDRTARVRWHATGLPTEESVLLLLSGLKALLAEKENTAQRRPRVHV